MKSKIKLAVLCSGNGTNLQAIIDASKQAKLDAEVVVVVSDKSKAFALQRAVKENIPNYSVDPKSFPVKEAFDEAIAKYIEDFKADYIVLAGYMRMLTPSFVHKYKNRILNIHPALLPSFKGVNGIKDAYNYGVKITGVTVHFVDEQMDHGPIILQEYVNISEDDTLVTLEKKIHSVEHLLYPKALQLVAENKLVFKDRRVHIKQ